VTTAQLRGHPLPADLSDAAFVRAVQAGDAQAFALLVQQHAASLRAVAIHVLGYVDEVDDAVQDALLVALRTLPQLRDPDAVGPWLRSAVRSRCLMRVRTRRATPVADPELLLPADAGWSRPRCWTGRATGDWVQQAVAELADPVREAVVLRYSSDWSSYRQIAQLCGVPEHTVRSRLRDGRQALAGALERTAAAAHADSGRAAEASRSRAEETIAASLGDGYADVLRERYSPDATVALPGRPPAGRAGLLAARDHTQERVQTAVGRATTQVAAARSLLLATAGELDRTAAAGRATTDAQRGALRGAMCLVTEVSRAALTTAYELGSSEPLARGSLLGRWFRDGMAAAQSADLSTAQWPLVGRVALGLPPAVPFV
jgi:RNA polymerase sigma factor (sigma-70 family)